MANLEILRVSYSSEKYLSNSQCYIKVILNKMHQNFGHFKFPTKKVCESKTLLTVCKPERNFGPKYVRSETKSVRKLNVQVMYQDILS